MSPPIEYASNRSTLADVAGHLRQCDAGFMPPLSGRVDLDDYARKIVDHAERFESWAGGELVGLVAAYCNDLESRIAYVSSVSVMSAWTGRQIAGTLLDRCIAHARSLGMRQVCLEVASANSAAIGLYRGRGFVEGQRKPPFIEMRLMLGGKDRP